jgi:catechol 2,3-dioxygenase-like lactoylglutathione lyase family enzyme
MFKMLSSFSGVSVDDTTKARDFYSTVLGLALRSEKMGLEYQLPGGGSFFIYEKKDHAPASYTALNFVVSDIDSAVAELKARGVVFEIYEGMHQDEHGIARGKTAGMGPDIAWFKDPAGNIVSVLQT